MNIRQLEPADALAFKTLRVFAMQESPTSFGSSVQDEEKRSIERIQFMLSSQSSFTLGVFDQDKLIGLARCEVSTREKTKHKADIFSVYIHPEFRGRGLSRQLFEQLISRAKTIDGLETLLLAVTEHNAPARALYVSLGFVQYGFEPDALRYQNQSIAEMFMRLELK